MKEIWKMYGQTLLYVILAAILVTLGIRSAGKSAEQIRITEREEGQEEALSALTRYYQGQNPVIAYRGGSLTAGDETALEDCFLATDETGRELLPQIRGIWDADGSMAEYPFRCPGVYRIEVRALDQNNRSTTARFWVPVNEGGI